MMTTLFPYFDDQFKEICRKIELLPDADIKQLQSDILNCAWGGPGLHIRSLCSQTDIKKMLQGIKTTTERHLKK
jgi:hypothetical protein